jgi:acetyl-CoA carboxylase biotin carboxyl carrier protein
MNLTAKDVAEITRLLESSAFDELYLESDGWKLTLRRGQAVGGDASASAGTPVVAAPVPGAAGASAPAVAAQRSTAASADGAEFVAAPMLGTFYRAPKPGAPPYVEAGSIVEPETIVGIIEVMKLMNTVRAGLRGTVLEVIARDGALVEYGEALLRVARAG